MGMLRVGYYPINANTAEHTYARMDYYGRTYNFHCYGGIKGKKNYYPAEYYESKGIWDTRKSANKTIRALYCHAQIALHLASWSDELDMKRTDYDRKSGGSSGLGDCAGIIYAIDGVCHQMCNTITCSTNTEEPFAAYINWPPSLNASKILYGNRGSFFHETAVKKYVSRLRKYYNVDSKDPFVRMAGNGDQALAEYLQEMNHWLLANVKECLQTGPRQEDRISIINSMIPECEEKCKMQSAIKEKDCVILLQKQELDNLLVRNQITYQEYTQKINELCRALVECYHEVLKEKDFVQCFGCGVEKVNCNIIEEEIINKISYEQIRKQIM